MLPVPYIFHNCVFVKSFTNAPRGTRLNVYVLFLTSLVIPQSRPEQTAHQELSPSVLTGRFGIAIDDHQ